MPPAPSVRSRAAGARRLALPLLLSLGAAGAAAAQPARTITVTLTKQASTYGGGVFDLRVVFSEDVAGLALNDFSATNATVGFLRSATGSAVGDLRAYLVEVTPAASGTITVKLRGGAAHTPVTSARDSRPATWVWDREGPKVTISGPASIQQDSDLSFPATDFTVRFDEALGYHLLLTSKVRFEATNGVVLGVTATTANPPVLTVSVRPTAVGTLTLSVPSGGFRDREGNTNAAASKSSTVNAYSPPNRPPVITAPSDRSFSQGETITAFDIEVSDPDDDTLTVGVSGLPSGLSYSAATGKVSGTVAADAAVKDYTATITANDGEASEVSATFTVTVARANGQPVITVPADRTYSRGETISTFAIEVSDPDKDSTTVGVSGLPPGLNWQSAVRWVSGTIGADAAVKDYTVTITANDGIAAEVRATFTITVKEAATAEPPQPLTSNSAPVITVPDDRAYRRGETITAFDIEVSDPDQDSVTVEVSGLPSGLAYSASTGKVSGTVAADAAIKDYTATIAATDKKAGEVNATFTVTVHPANRAPTITNPGDKSYRQGETITAFAIAVSDADSDSPTVGVSGLPTGLSYSAATGKVSGTVAADAAIKDYTATITADDGRAPEVSATFTVTVTRANRAPTITNPGDKSYRQGETITAFAVAVSDADGDSPTVGVSGLPTGLAYSASTGKVSGTVAADAALKDYTATITADDGRAPEVSATFTVTVRRANRPPTLTVPEAQTYAQGETIANESVGATDPDGDTLSLGVTGLPAGLSCSPNASAPAGAAGCSLTGTVAADAEAKNYTATATANDGGKEVSATFTITVTEIATAPPAGTPANAAPVIGAPADRTYIQGETITAFAIPVSDTDGDTPTVAVTGLPSGLAYTASTGEVSGTVAADAAVKDYTATITANDGKAAEVSATFTVTVTRANREPVVTTPDDLTVAPGETIGTRSITAADADDDPLSLSVTGLPAGLSCSAHAAAGNGSAGCDLTGTVAADATAKDYPVTATASDGKAPVSSTFTITVTEPAPPQPNHRNSAPAISAPADRAYEQGEAIAAFSIPVTDPDDDPVTVTVAGLPAGLAYSASSGTVSGVVADDAQAAAYPVTIRADDGVNPAVSAAFTITITAAAGNDPGEPVADNSPPVIAAPSDRTYSRGESIAAVPISVTDPDRDRVSVAVSGLPAGLAYRSGAVRGVVAEEAEVKPHRVTISAEDGVNPPAAAGFTITVRVSERSDGNRPPRILAPGNRIFSPGEAVSPFFAAVTDDDGDALTVTLRGLPRGLTHRTTTHRTETTVTDIEFSGTVTADPGRYPITIRAADGVHGPITGSFTVTVLDPGTPGEGEPRPLLFSRIRGPDLFYRVGRTIEPEVLPSASGGVGRITYAVTPTLPDGLLFDGAERELTGTPTTKQRQTGYRLTATDEGGDRATLRFTITIVDPPVVTGLRITSRPQRGHTYRRDEVVEVAADFSDRIEVEGTPALTLGVGGRPRAMEFAGAEAASLRFRYRVARRDLDPNGVSIEANALSVTSGRLTDSLGTEADLSHPALPDQPNHRVNGAPEVAFSTKQGPDLFYRVGRTIEPEVLPSASGGVGRITYAVTPTLPDGLLFDGAERELTGTPTTKQRQTGYRLTATDEGGDRATLRFTITIVDPPVVTGLRITSRPQRGHTYRRDEVVEVAADFSDRIEVEGTPALTLGVGGRPRAMEFAGAEAASLRFRYRVARRDLDPNGVSIEANALSVTSGRLTDSLGTEADLSHAALPDQPNHRVNGAPEGTLPVLASLRLTSRPRRDSIYRSGELIEAEARYRETVGPEEVPLLALRIGHEVRQMGLVEHRGAAFVYRYRVVPVDHDPDGVSLAANAVPTGAGWLAEAFDAAAASVYAVLPDQPDHRVDGAPQAVGTLPALRLTLGAAPARVPLEGAFRGAAGYTAESSAPAVAAVTLEGEALVVTPRADGSATVTVTGRNAGGDSTHSIGVTVVTAGAEIAVVGGAFAGLGRSALSSAAASIGARLRETGRASAVHLAGRPAPDEAAPFSGFGTGAAGFVRGLPGSLSSDSFHSGLGSVTETAATAGSDSGSLFEQLMAGSAFSLTGTDLTEGPTGAPAEGNAGENGSGRRWAFWGAGDRQSFEGGAGSTYDGAPLTAYLGADLAIGRVLAGLAWSASRAETQYDFHDLGAEARGSGDLSTRLLGLHPYLRWSPDDRTDFWGIGGVGRGSAELSRSVTAVGERADLGLVFGLAGVRRELASGRRGRLALRFDAGAARLSAEGGGAVLDGMAARVFRTRLGVEVSRGFGAATPFVVVDALYDGGDGATGAGVEIAGGVRAASAGGRAGVEARGRILALHGESGYRETGASLTFRLGPARNEKGLALDLTPAWGEAPDDFSVGSGAGLSSGSRSLGGPGRGLTTLAGAAPETGGSLGARASYRLGAAAPFTEIRWEQSRSRQARVGVRLGRRDGRFGLDLLGERQEARDRPALFRFGLFGRVEF